MKSTFFIFMTIFALVCGSALSSCSKSNQDLIKEYKELCDEIVKAAKDGDEAKVEKLGEKLEKVGEELDKRDLTDKEKEEVEEYAINMLGELYQYASDVMGGYGF